MALTWHIIKAAIEEGVVVGGGCCLLRLSKKVDVIKELLDNEEQKVPFVSSSFKVVHMFKYFNSAAEFRSNIYHYSLHKHVLVLTTIDLASTCAQIGAEIFKRALSYPAKLIAKNAGVNGKFVVQKVSAY